MALICTVITLCLQHQCALACREVIVKAYAVSAVSFDEMLRNSAVTAASLDSIANARPSISSFCGPVDAAENGISNFLASIVSCSSTISTISSRTSIRASSSFIAQLKSGAMCASPFRSFRAFAAVNTSFWLCSTIRAFWASCFVRPSVDSGPSMAFLTNALTVPAIVRPAILNGTAMAAVRTNEPFRAGAAFSALALAEADSEADSSDSAVEEKGSTSFPSTRPGCSCANNLSRDLASC